MTPETLLLLAVAALLVFFGFAGMIMPALPGAPMVFVGLLIAAWAENFAYVGPWALTALGGIALLTYLVDFLAGAFGAKKFGASKEAMIGATLGAIVGIFFGPLGILVGPFTGAVIGELSVQPNLRAAGMSGVGATLGLLLGTAAKIALAFMMLGLFAILRFWS